MIYCVEDDDSIRELMLYALRASGFEAEGFRDSVGLFDALSRSQPQLIMLDIMLPGMDGIEILKALRGNPATARIPVILASARGTEYDKVVGLDLGADDYLAKPFGMMEMVSRIRAVLRRTAPAAAPGLLQMGNLRMDSTSHTVYAGDTRVELTLKDQYYNMKEMVEPHMYLIHRARAAMTAVGVEPAVVPVRGGTDGARLSYMGLPCPNLGTGGINFHGVHEYIPVNALEKMTDVLVNLVKSE